MTIFRRVLASLTLGALALTWAPPPGCPVTPSRGGGAPAIGAAMADAACDHTAAGPCMGALGCVTVAPAIANVPTTLVVPADLITFAIRPAPQFGDLFRTGPPTPPPNQI